MITDMDLAKALHELEVWMNKYGMILKAHPMKELKGQLCVTFWDGEGLISWARHICEKIEETTLTEEKLAEATEGCVPGIHPETRKKMQEYDPICDGCWQRYLNSGEREWALGRRPDGDEKKCKHCPRMTVGMLGVYGGPTKEECKNKFNNIVDHGLMASLTSQADLDERTFRQEYEGSFASPDGSHVCDECFDRIPVEEGWDRISVRVLRQHGNHNFKRGKCSCGRSTSFILIPKDIKPEPSKPDDRIGTIEREGQ